MRPVLFGLLALEILGKVDVIVPVGSLMVDDNAAGNAFRKSDRMEGMQAQTIPMGTSIVLHIPMLT